MAHQNGPISVNTISSPDSPVQAGIVEHRSYRPRRTRVPLSCHECSRRKIRCDKKIPCRPCLERDEGTSCRRRHNALYESRPVHIDQNSDASPAVDVQTELAALKARLTKVEAELSKQRGTTSEAYSEDDKQAVVEFEENGLAGAMEEAALGIGENQRRRGAPLDILETFPSHAQNERPWFSPISFPECLDRLPTHAQSELLVQFYFEYLNWMNGCLHKPTFLEEHEKFWTQYEEKGPQDGTVLGLIFAVLSVAGFFLDQERIDDSGFDYQELQKLARLWFDCSLATFFRCQGLFRPSLMGCQTILTLNYAFHLSGNTAAHVTLTNVILGLARTLNLHLLGGEKRGSNEEILRREIGRRVWWHTVDTEWFLLPYHRFTSVAPHQFDTALPDLTDDGIYASSSKDLHSLSFLLTCCQSSRLLYELYGSLEQRHFPSYEAVLNTSAKLDQIVENLPLELQPFRDMQKTNAVESRDGIKYLRRFLGMLTAYRSYLIHRAYFAKSLRGEAYTESRTACVRAAGTILTLSDNGLPATFYRLWNTTLWLVSAGLILALDMIYAASDRRILPDVAARRRRLNGLIDLLQTLGDRSGIGARGAKLIGHLCTIEHDISTGKMSAVTFTTQDINTFVRNDPHERSHGTVETATNGPNHESQPSAAYQTLPMDALAGGAFEDSIFLPSAWGGFNPSDASVAAAETFESFGPSGQGNEVFDMFDDWILQSAGQ